MFSPTSFPKRLMTSRKFMLSVSTGFRDHDSPHGLSDDAQMATMLKLMLHAHNVLLVFRIGVVELFQDLSFLPASYIPDCQRKL